MKKQLCLLLAVTVLAFLFPWLSPAAKAEERELTILVYICGTDLESESGKPAAISGKWHRRASAAPARQRC